MPKDHSARYFLEEFESEDRLAVVLINKHTDSVIQRIGSARQMASPESQLCCVIRTGWATTCIAARTP